MRAFLSVWVCAYRSLRYPPSSVAFFFPRIAIAPPGMTCRKAFFIRRPYHNLVLNTARVRHFIQRPFVPSPLALAVIAPCLLLPLPKRKPADTIHHARNTLLPSRDLARRARIARRDIKRRVLREEIPRTQEHSHRLGTARGQTVRTTISRMRG